MWEDIGGLASATIEIATREPVVSPAGLSRAAVGIVFAALPVNCGARKGSPLETFLSFLLLTCIGEVARGDEFFDDGVILTDAEAVHPRVVTVVVDAPLDVHHFPLLEGLHHLAPVGAWLVVVDLGALVEAAGA